MPGRCSSDWARAAARAPFEVTCADCRFSRPRSSSPGSVFLRTSRRGSAMLVASRFGGAPACNAKHRGWSCTFPVRKPVRRSPAQAGFTSPAARLSAAISRSESPLTTAISRSLSSVSPKCCLVASMALNGTAMATLKYRNDGGPKPRRPTQRDRASSDGWAGIVSCTTQPAGDALSVIHRDLGYITPPSQATSRSKRARTAADGLFLLIRRPG
jgi:hypothetical protein